MSVINVFEAGAKLGPQASSVTNVRPDMSGSMAVAKVNTQLANTIANGSLQIYDQITSADIMKANNEYNDKMAKLQTKLLENKEENARDNLTKYEEGRKKIIGEVFKNNSSLRYGRAAQALQQTMDRDWIGQRTQMERYQLTEMEKYKDTQLNNQYVQTLKDVTTNYNDEAALKGYLNRGIYMTEQRYANFGKEKIQQASDKWKAAVVGSAVNAAVNAENYERAGELLQGYGYMMDPSQRMQIDKVVSARQKNDSELNTFGSIFASTGKDIEAGVRALKATYGTADIAKGKEFLAGQLGKYYGSNQCANFVKAYVRAAGGDEAITSALADGTYRNAEEKGLTFSDKGELRDGDIVYWQVDGSGYSASNDPEDVNSTSKAYKGITHVGIYNAKTGKVIQSGEHGVSELALDAKGYNVVGYSHIGGKAMSLAEQEKLEKDYRAYAIGKVNQKRAQVNLMIENACDDMMAAYNQGERRPEYYMDMAKRIAGNDYSAYVTLTNVAKSFTGGGTRKPTLEEQLEIEDAIEAGGLGQDELVAKLQQAGYSADTTMKYVRMLRKANKDNTREKFDWNGIIGALKARVGSDKIPAEWMPGLRLYGKRAIREYIEDPKRGNGHAPTVDWVLDTLQDGLVKGVGNVTVDGKHFWNKNTSYNMAQLANHSIYYIEDAGNGNVDIYFYGNSVPVRRSKEQLRDIIGE